MSIPIQRRAEIALRSLHPTERRRVLRALATLEATEPQIALASGKLHRLVDAAPEGNLYSYRGSQRLRVILSRDQASWTVEDIVDHDRLNRIFSASTVNVPSDTN